MDFNINIRVYVSDVDGENILPGTGGSGPSETHPGDVP